MKPKIIREDENPHKDSLVLIGEAIAKIKPDKQKISDWYSVYADFHKNRLAHDLDHIKNHVPKNSKIVEFGSIPPILTLALNNLNYSVTGVDIEPSRFQSAIEGTNLEIYKSDIEIDTLPFPDDQFDAAIFNEIFEHLRINPIHTMKQVFRVIRPGGILMLSTPNLTSLYGWYNLLIENKAPGDIFSEYEKIEKILHMGHVRVYTPVELAMFLKKVGFDVLQVIYRGSYVHPNKWLEKTAKRILFVFPRLKPYFSIIAKKPPSVKK